MGFLIIKSTTINNVLQKVIRKLQGIAFPKIWYIGHDNWTQNGCLTARKLSQGALLGLKYLK